MKNKVKNYLRNSRLLRYFFRLTTHVANQRSIQRNKHNSIINNNGLAFRCKFRIRGSNNRIIIDDFARIMRCKIYISGNDNVVEIGKNTFIENSAILMDFDHNRFSIGKNSIISRGFEGSCMEGMTISIGDDCLFSGNISIRTCDSHSVLDKTGKRINTSQNVFVGNHVWIGTNALLLKGTQVLDNCIVGARSVLTKKYDKSNVVIVGQPAVIVKEDVTWDKKLIR